MERVVHEAEGRGSRDGSGLRRTQGLQSKANGRRDIYRERNQQLVRRRECGRTLPGGLIM